MAETVSFKVYMKEFGSEDQAEVRRIVMDKDASNSLTYLREKLSTVFPHLKNEIFAINWTNEDGDKVTINTDEELIFALTEMKGPVYKIQVLIKGGERQEEAKNSGNMSGKVHPNVTCDGCERPVVGFRYRCMVCDNYDLCGNCDTAGIHPGHNMIRIASSQVNFPHHFFKRLHKMQDKAKQKSHCRQERQENPGDTAAEATNDNDIQFHEGWFGGFGGAGRGRSNRGMFRGRGGPRGGAWTRGPMSCPRGGAWTRGPMGCPRGGAWTRGPKGCPRGGAWTRGHMGCPRGGAWTRGPMGCRVFFTPPVKGKKQGKRKAMNRHLQLKSRFISSGKRQRVSSFASTSSSNSISQTEMMETEEGSKKNNNSESEKENDLKDVFEDSNTLSSADDEDWTVPQRLLQLQLL